MVRDQGPSIIRPEGLLIWTRAWKTAFANAPMKPRRVIILCSLGGGDLVPYPLSDQLPLELGKRQQHIEREPPHAGARVEGLRDRHERDAVDIEQLDEFGEIRERAREPIDLVNQHNVDRARPDMRQELLQSGPLERGAGECTV